MFSFIIANNIVDNTQAAYDSATKSDATDRSSFMKGRA
ncbi:hypothetical protein CEV34_4353 [Brucella pseudogrignonensis]|uniref:Uncharacterized protein n=1 Tax=Brucella pseudogrignonensis TaxID=419475 RepID=A0A256G781_9HYPH|nr:hypothetical protein CEV34_4353 [Brucella pseudogrignonensis]